jgi:uncharacterized protein (DUF111 family)
MKVRTIPTGEEASPEHDDCRAAADRAGVSWRAVAQAALAAWQAAPRSPGTESGKA